MFSIIEDIETGFENEYNISWNNFGYYNMYVCDNDLEFILETLEKTSYNYIEKQRLNNVVAEYIDWERLHKINNEVRHKVQLNIVKCRLETHIRNIIIEREKEHIKEFKKQQRNKRKRELYKLRKKRVI